MAQNPVTTIPPLTDTNQIPLCATACGPLYDANGACVPPAAKSAEPSVYTACFCSQKDVAPFSTGTAGVCDGACQGEELGTIASWFQDICSVNGNGGNDDSTTTTDGGSSSGDSSGSSEEGGGGSWLDGHWKYVVMLVILVVAIAGIWIGACIWRRRYLRKKDRQTSLGQKQSGSTSHPSWGPGSDVNPEAFAHNSTAQGVFMPGAGATASASASSDREKQQPPPPKKVGKKKKWAVNERT